LACGLVSSRSEEVARGGRERPLFARTRKLHAVVIGGKSGGGSHGERDSRIERGSNVGFARWPRPRSQKAEIDIKAEGEEKRYDNGYARLEQFAQQAQKTPSEMKDAY